VDPGKPGKVLEFWDSDRVGSGNPVDHVFCLSAMVLLVEHLASKKLFFLLFLLLIIMTKLSQTGGTAAASLLPFRLGNPAFCGSQPPGHPP